MPITAPARKDVQYPTDAGHATLLKAWVDAVTTAANAGTLTANALSADTDGRAVMATGYFSEAKATDAFAAGAITGLLLKAGALAASTQGRALMATGYFTEAKATDAFAAQAITGALLKNLAVDTAQIAANAVTGAKLAAVLCSAPTTRSGPGACAITAPTCLVTTTGAGDALTVADGTYNGQRLTLVHVVDGGTGVITQTTGAKLTAAIATITLTNAYDTVTLEWSGALWNPVAWSGATTIVNT